MDQRIVMEAITGFITNGVGQAHLSNVLRIPKCFSLRHVVRSRGHRLKLLLENFRIEQLLRERGREAQGYGSPNKVL